MCEIFNCITTIFCYQGIRRGVKTGTLIPAEAGETATSWPRCKIPLPSPAAEEGEQSPSPEPGLGAWESPPGLPEGAAANIAAITHRKKKKKKSVASTALLFFLLFLSLNREASPIFKAKRGFRASGQPGVRGRASRRALSLGSQHAPPREMGGKITLRKGGKYLLSKHKLLPGG